MFEVFFKLGWHHLTEAGAWDHQLFLATIALAYAPVQWRKWIALATAFAIGHSLALIAATTHIVPAGMGWVEPAIALSILILALIDLGLLLRDPLRREKGSTYALLAGLVLVFGFIHGLGFASAFMMLQEPGQTVGQMWQQLLAFTLGVEAAQLVILGAMWALAFIIFDLLQWYPIKIRQGLLVAIALTATYIFYQTLAS